MKQLGIDGRSYEEKLIEELKEEVKQRDGGESRQISSMGIAMKPGQSELVMNPHRGKNVPQVSVIIDKNKNYAPKQNLKKPEKSI